MVQSLLRWCSLWEDVEAFLVGKAQPEVLKLFRSNWHYCCFIMTGSSWIAVGCSLSVCDWPLTTFLYFSNVELSVCGGRFGQVWHIYYDVLTAWRKMDFSSSQILFISSVPSTPSSQVSRWICSLLSVMIPTQVFWSLHWRMKMSNLNALTLIPLCLHLVLEETFPGPHSHVLCTYITISESRSLARHRVKL